MTDLGYNLHTLLKRLEAATTRLEDVTVWHEQHGDALAKSGAANTAPAVPTALAVAPTAPPAAPDAPADTLVPKPFADFVADDVTPFVTAAGLLSAEVQAVAAAFAEAVAAQGEFLALATTAAKPADSDAALADALKPTSLALQKIAAQAEAKSDPALAMLLKMVAEGSAVLQWVLVPTPVSFVPEYKDSAQFWGNKVLKEKEEAKVGFVKAFYRVFDGLRDVVKAEWPTGPWKTGGKPLADVLKAAGLAPAPAPAVLAAPAAGGPPPPPPPPPANLYDDIKAAPAAGSRDALFSELSKGTAITSGLKKVDKSQMTHKNPALKAAPPVPSKPKKPASLLKAGAAPAAAPVRPPKKELADSKWLIANYTSGEVEIEGEIHQLVLVSNCSNATVTIRGKVNAISVTNCSKVGVVVELCVLLLDVIKLSKFGVQVTGTVPLILVDQSADGSVYLGADLTACEVYTLQATGLNVNVLDGEDYKELPLPEQLKHTFVGGVLKTEVVEHSG